MLPHHCEGCSLTTVSDAHAAGCRGAQKVKCAEEQNDRLREELSQVRRAVRLRAWVSARRSVSIVRGILWLWLDEWQLAR